MDRMKGKVAIVTGGASGIGRAITERLNEEGALVVITDMNDVAGEKTASEIGGIAHYIHHDVAKEEDWQHVVDWTVKKFSKIDILVNNAGIGSPNSRPENADLAHWRKVQSVNLEGTFLGCKYSIPVMEGNKGGAIVNISSVASSVPTAGDLAYGASKAGIWQLTRSLAFHCAKNNSNIRVNSIHPGAILTEGIQQRRAKEVLDQIGHGIPMGHMGAPEDIANAVLFLASSEAKYITGQSLAVDGGFLLSPMPAMAP